MEEIPAGLPSPPLPTPPQFVHILTETTQSILPGLLGWVFFFFGPLCKHLPQGEGKGALFYTLVIWHKGLFLPCSVGTYQTSSLRPDAEDPEMN